MTGLCGMLVNRLRGAGGEPLDSQSREQAAAHLEVVYVEIRQAFLLLTGQEARAVGRFAIGALAGEIATKYGPRHPAGAVQ